MKEHQHVEWKETWRDEHMRWICGFANAEGGVLVIGRNDRGQAVGVNDARKLLQDIPNKVRDIMGIMVDVNLVEADGKETLEILVEPYPYPVSYKGEYHYRSGGTKQELKGAALDRFLLRKQGRHWDSVPVPYVALADLDSRSLANFRRRAGRSGRLSAETLQEVDADLIDKLHLMDGSYLKRAAVLLFHPDPERFVTGAYVKIGYFRSNADLLFQDEIHGSLFSQVDESMDRLLNKYLKALISYEGIQRVETYPVPEEALREAVLNAVMHKDYASAVPIQISVYEDKIILWNSGQLPEMWTLEKLLSKHPSIPYNPLIANAFFRAGFIEAWGRGIEKIQLECERHDILPPEFDYSLSGLMLTFYANAGYVAQLRRATLGERSGEKLGEKLGERLGERLGETRAAIILAMIDNPKITVTKLAAQLSISTTAVEKNINYLKTEGYIRRIGPARGGHWEVVE